MEALVCCICMEDVGSSSLEDGFSQTPSKTFLRPCPGSSDHTFCEDCFRDWCLEAKVHRKHLSCPVCRREIKESFEMMMSGESRHYSYSHPDKIKKILNYRGGKFHGSQLYYFQHSGPSDNLEIALNYDEGELDGIQRRYYNVFQRKKGEVILKHGLWKESPYQKGVCHGLCREWHLNGKLKTEYTMEKGLLEGEYKVFNGRGTLISVTLFEKGIMKEMTIEGVKMDYSEMAVPPSPHQPE